MNPSFSRQGSEEKEAEDEEGTHLHVVVFGHRVAGAGGLVCCAFPLDGDPSLWFR